MRSCSDAAISIGSSPGTRLSAIYRASYPSGGADALEFENLQLTLRQVFHVPEEGLNALWDATVEDVIQLCLACSKHSA